MRAYEVSKSESAAPVFRADLDQVREILRTVPKDARDGVRVYLVDFPDDKRARVDNLNAAPAEKTRERLRAWRVGGARGGQLVELERLED